jgi:hypothetical protein
MSLIFDDKADSIKLTGFIQDMMLAERIPNICICSWAYSHKHMKWELKYANTSCPATREHERNSGNVSRP